MSLLPRFGEAVRRDPPFSCNATEETGFWSGSKQVTARKLSAATLFDRRGPGSCGLVVKSCLLGVFFFFLLLLLFLLSLSVFLLRSVTPREIHGWFFYLLRRGHSLTQFLLLKASLSFR